MSQFADEMPEFTVSMGSVGRNYAGFMLGGNAAVSVCGEESFNAWTEITHCDPSKDTEYITKAGGHASLANAYDMRIATSVSVYCESDDMRMKRWYRDLRITPCGRIHSISEEYTSVFEDVLLNTTASLGSLSSECSSFVQIDSCSVYTPPPPPPTTCTSSGDCDPSIGSVDADWTWPDTGFPPSGGGTMNIGTLTWRSYPDCDFWDGSSTRCYYDSGQGEWMVDYNGTSYTAPGVYTDCATGPVGTYYLMGDPNDYIEIS
tara:strand:- start:4443 stop:5225 length:783 start_codon:yes stop_codon:yes gene_type:complete